MIGDAAERLPNRLRVRVEDISFVGPVSQIAVAAVAEPDLRLMVKLPSRAAGIPLAVGDETDIGWSDRRMPPGDRREPGRRQRADGGTRASPPIASPSRSSPMRSRSSSSCCR